MDEAWETSYRKNDVIVREGDIGTSIYKILSGSAAVFSDYGGSGEKQLAVLHAGDYFGEMAVIEITCRSATVVAQEDETRLAVVDASDLSGYLSEHKGEINNIAHHLGRRLRELTNNYTEVCNTLRELGRLDTSVDKLNESLLDRIKRFAEVYLMGRRTGQFAEEAAEPVRHAAPQKLDKGLALVGREYRKGDVIFREGGVSDCMYYIYEGRVDIYTDYGTERQKLLTALTPEMFFGEMGLFDGLRRTATAIALEDGTFVEMTCEKDLDVILEKNPAMALMLLQHLSNRMRRLTADYLKACKALAGTEEELEAHKAEVTPELLAQAEYMNQLLLAPELLY